MDWFKIPNNGFRGKKTPDQRFDYHSESLDTIFGLNFSLWVSYIIKYNYFEPEKPGWYFYFSNHDNFQYFGFTGPFTDPEIAKEACIREVTYELQRIYDLLFKS